MSNRRSARGRTALRKFFPGGASALARDADLDNG